MAHVVITREEAEEEGKLPAVCMCCGGPATAFVTRRMMLKPPRFNQIELAEIAIFRTIHALATSPYVNLRTRSVSNIAITGSSGQPCFMAV